MARLLVVGLLLALLAPVLLPVAQTVAAPPAVAELGRLLPLAGNTLALAALSILIAVPAGTLAALALERSPVPGRRFLRAAVVVALVTPLPVWAVGWQAVLGNWLPSLSPPGEVAWRPWTTGLLPAAWIHGTAGLPWVVWIVSAAVRTTDPGLEDDAVLAGGPVAVWRRVLLPRALPAAALAAGWVAIQAGRRDRGDGRPPGPHLRRGAVHPIRHGRRPGSGRGGERPAVAADRGRRRAAAGFWATTVRPPAGAGGSTGD